MPVHRAKINAKFFFVYSFIRLVPLIINYIWVIVLRGYRSEFHSLPVKLSNIEITFILTCLITGYFIIFILYLLFDNRRVVFSKKYIFYFNRKKCEYLLFLIIIVNLIFYFLTGIGKAGNWEKSPISFLIYFFNWDFLFLIYYLTYREDATRKFWLLTILHCVFQIAKGWTSFVLTFVLIELFYRSSKKGFLKYLLVIPSVFFIGAFFYQFLYPFKFFIRVGYFEQISYQEALIKIIERLSFFSHASVGIQNSDKIVSLYRGYGYKHTELIGFFRPVLPSFMFPNKDFRSLGNLIMQSYYPNIQATTSSNMGFFSYFYNLIRIDISDFILYFYLFTLLAFIYKFILDLVLANKKGSLKQYNSYMFFIYMVAFFSVSALENLDYAWFSITWTYILMMFLKIIRIKRIKLDL